VNRATGGGVENKNHYENIEVIFLNIPNIHAVRDAFNAAYQALSSNSPKFLSALEKSG